VSQQTTNRYFDELASGLASGSISRGRALRLMGAALVGGTLASLGIREASADLCKSNGKACKKNSQCCSGNCVSGACSACAADRVLLSNGTCAKPCTGDGDGQCTGDGCVCAATPITGKVFCATGGSRAGCITDSDCTIPGEFCTGNFKCSKAC